MSVSTRRRGRGAANASDRWHAPVVAWLREHQGVRLVTTWPVLYRGVCFAGASAHNEAALDSLRWIQRGAIEVERAEVTTLANVLAISYRFADLPFDLADASVAEAGLELRPVA